MNWVGLIPYPFIMRKRSRLDKGREESMNQIDEKEVLHRLTVVEERSKSNTHRIDDITEEIHTVKKLEVKQEEDRRDIQKLKEDSSMLYKLVANQEVMNSNIANLVKDNKEQNKESKEQMKAFTETLGNMNKNLTALNTTQQQMSNEIQIMQKDISSTKSHVKEVEALAESNRDKGKFDVLALLTQDMPKAIALALLAAILTYWGIR